MLSLTKKRIRKKKNATNMSENLKIFDRGHSFCSIFCVLNNANECTGLLFVLECIRFDCCRVFWNSRISTTSDHFGLSSTPLLPIRNQMNHNEF